MASNVDELLNRVNEIESSWEQMDNAFDSKVSDLENYYSSLPSNIDIINALFEEKTSLSKADIPFILFCAGLQAVRQLYFTNFKERLDDKKSAAVVKKVEEQYKEVGGGVDFKNKKRTNYQYFASLEDIVVNPVPFDTTKKLLDKGSSGSLHRFTCLGHYPHLGYLFGTANIMTSTISFRDYNKFLPVMTYHVYAFDQMNKSFMFSGHSMEQMIGDKADTMEMFEKIAERFQENPKEASAALIISLLREHLHLRSDEKSTQSLPFPGLSFTPKIAHSLQRCGIDYMTFKTVSKQACISELVNMITTYLYYASFMSNNQKKIFFKKKEIPMEIKVKAKKIINVANVISSYSNIGIVLAGVTLGDMSMIRKFDFGGGFITIVHLSKSADFITEMQRVYLADNLSKLANNHV